MIATNAMSNSENMNGPAAFKGYKWKEIIKPIWDSDEAKQKRKQKKKNVKRKKHMVKAFSQAIQTPCVSDSNF